MGDRRDLGYRIWGVAMTVLFLATAVFPQTELKPGFNLFSVQQDVEMGAEAAKEVERQLPLLNDRDADRFIKDLGLKIARETDMPNLPWQFKVVNSSDVNAFALPGGYVYVNRGLIETARTEGELAGVLAHESSHVVLRHGTNQLSKAYLAQAPLSILGGVLGGGWQAALAQLGIGFVVNSLFLKFSRTIETQADVRGVQLLADAGYDPHQMVGIFETLRDLQGHNPSKVEQFFSDHPSPENRIQRINEEISKLPSARSPIINTYRFESVQARLKAMPPAPKVQPGARSTDNRRGQPEPPSRDYRTYRQQQGLYEIPYPANWQVYDGQGPSVTFAPEGGIRQISNQSQLAYGVIVNVVQPAQSNYGRSESLTLEDATDQVIAQLQRDNPYLRVVQGDRQNQRGRRRRGGAQEIQVIMEGSPQRGYVERVNLVTRWMGDQVIYLLLVTPAEDFNAYLPTFDAMKRGLRVSDTRSSSPRS